jgi:hypothetical protein
VPIESISAAAETKEGGGITGGGGGKIGIGGGGGGITGLLSFPHDIWVITIKDIMSVTKTFLPNIVFL